MKLSLPANISRLRKERSMTQEQLAEALGVTFASVSKWERGAATPELGLIAELADLFEVSMDALVGYEFQNNDKDSVVERLKQYAHGRDHAEAFSDIEKALQRYPNSFEVVYYSARVYRVAGLTQKNEEYSKRALSLYSRACLLIKENADPQISETSVREEIAELYLALGAYDKGVALLKQNNPCRVHHPTIGYTLASSCGDPEGALPYLSMALLDLISAYMKIVMGYIHVFYETKNHVEALAVTDWALGFCSGLKKPEKCAFMDKYEAVLWAIRADILLALRRQEDAAASLRTAKTLAKRFDEAPDYDASSIRFVSHIEPASAFDDMGDTAMGSLNNVVAELDDQELSKLWSAVRDEA